MYNNTQCVLIDFEKKAKKEEKKEGKTKADLFLLPDVVVDGHLAPLPLLPPPLLGVAAHVVELLVGQLQVVGQEEVHLLPVEAPEDVQHASVVVQPVDLLFIHLFIEGLYSFIGPSTTQGHHRAFHKLKSRTS